MSSPEISKKSFIEAFVVEVASVASQETNRLSLFFFAGSISVIISTLIPRKSNNFLNTCECAPVSIIDIFWDSNGIIDGSTGFSSSTFCIIVGIRILSVSPSMQITLSAKNNSLRLRVRYCFTNL